MSLFNSIYWGYRCPYNQESIIQDISRNIDKEFGNRTPMLNFTGEIENPNDSILD